MFLRAKVLSGQRFHFRAMSTASRFDHRQIATEALLMKMKIFKGSDLQSLESKINEWLEAKGINLIHHITHANNLSTTIITVWWRE